MRVSTAALVIWPTKVCVDDSVEGSVGILFLRDIKYLIAAPVHRVEEAGNLMDWISPRFIHILTRNRHGNNFIRNVPARTQSPRQESEKNKGRKWRSTKLGHDS